MRFIQFADAHLDSTLGGALNLPAEKKAALREDLRTAVARALSLASEHDAGLVLIPGDLFDYESLTPETVDFLGALFRESAPARVFIAPGNHDSLRPGSPYLSAADHWPDNVHVFTTPEFETIDVPELGCSVTGIAHAHRGLTGRLLADRMPRPDRGHSILLFHGSRDGYRPSEKENVIPFSDDELLAQGFTYSAIGHYHSFAEIRGARGHVRAAYSGCVQGRGLDEAGEKCVLVGEIVPDGTVELRKVEVAPRRVVCVEVSLTGAQDNASILQRIDNAAAAAGVRPCDIVNVSLAGAVRPALEIDTSPLESSGEWFHVNVSRSRLELDYDLEALARESSASPVRSAFVRRMLDLRAQATLPEEQRTIEDALYYGLYALDGRRPEPRDAD